MKLKPEDLALAEGRFTRDPENRMALAISVAPSRSHTDMAPNRASCDRTFERAGREPRAVLP